MKDQEKQSYKETREKEKRIAEDSKNLAREQQQKKDYLAKEQALEIIAKVKENERAQQRAAASLVELKKEKLRKDDYLAREKINDESQEARKLKDKKNLQSK